MVLKNRYNFAEPFSVVDPHSGLYSPQNHWCWLSPCGRVGYVQIHKCASTQMGGWCQQQGWKRTKFWGEPQDPQRRYLVLLRDPVDRWISGTKQWIKKNNYVPSEFSDQIWHLIHQHLTFDDHTVPQYRFLLGLKIKSIDAVDVVPGEHTSVRVQTILRQYGYNCWLDPLKDRNRNPMPVDRVLDWFSSDSFLERFYRVYSEDYWLRLWLLDCAVPSEILKSRK